MGHPVPTPPGALNADATPTPGAAPVDGGAPKGTEQAAEATEEKPAKKDKSKQARLVYSDNEFSPEEKMAGLPRYAFVPNRMGETTLDTLPPATVVARATRDPDDAYLDPTD